MALEQYKYKVQDKSKNYFEDTIDAVSKIEAKQILENRGFKVIKVEKSSSNFLSFLTLKSTKLSKELELEFFKDLHSFLKLGENLNNSLELISRNKVANKLVKINAHYLLQDCTRGINFGEALLKRKFNKDIANIVKSGIEIGELTETINLIIEKSELELKVSKGFKSLFILPMIMVPILLVGQFFLLWKLTPIHKENFANTIKNPKDIPGTSAILFHISDHLFIYTGILAATIIGTIFGIYFLIKTNKTIRNKIAEKILYIPVVGQFIYYKEMAKLTSMLNLGYGSGFKMEDTIFITKNQIENSYIKNQFETIYKLVSKNGESVSQAMLKVNFDQSVLSSIGRGESSGRKEVCYNLKKLTETYKDKTLDKLKSMDAIKGLVGTILILAFGMPLAYTAMMPQLDLTQATMKSIRKH